MLIKLKSAAIVVLCFILIYSYLAYNHYGDSMAPPSPKIVVDLPNHTDLEGAIILTSPDIELRLYAPDKYQFFEKLSHNPLFTKEQPTFTVYMGTDRDPIYTVPKANEIKIDKHLLNNSAHLCFFESHELGHLEYGHNLAPRRIKEEIVADNFAAQLCGKEETLAGLTEAKTLKGVYKKEVEKRIRVLKSWHPN